MNTTILQQILTALDRDNKSTLYDVILQTLRSRNPAHQRHRDSILLHIPDVLDVLFEHSNDALVIGAMRIATATYQAEVQSLIQQHSSFNFKGTTALLAQLEDFSIARMGQRIQELAPHLWVLLGVLLDADHLQRKRKLEENPSNLDMDVDVDPSDIAMAMFGNDGSNDDESDDEGLDDSTDSSTDEAEIEGSDHEGAEADNEGECTPPKRHYRKQNAARRNTILLFIVSVMIKHFE